MSSYAAKFTDLLNAFALHSDLMLQGLYVSLCITITLHTSMVINDNHNC